MTILNDLQDDKILKMIEQTVKKNIKTDRPESGKLLLNLINFINSKVTVKNAL